MFKYFANSVMLLAATGFAFAQGEKSPDTRENTVSGGRSFSIAGNLDGSQTFDRRFLVTYDGTCAAVNSDSSNDGVSYDVYNISSAAGENLDAEVVLNTLGDSVLFLYCDGFDPLNPAANLVAWDDDSGVGLASAIVPADGVALSPATTYQLVVTGFGPAHLGTYDLIVGGTILNQGAVAIPTLSQWGLIAFLSLIGVAALLIARRASATA